MNSIPLRSTIGRYASWLLAGAAFTKAAFTRAAFTRAALLGAALVGAAFTGSVYGAAGVGVPAAQEGRQPAALDGTGVEYRLGQSLTPHIAFRDEANNHVTMGQYFDGRRPILLSFNYSNCPAQCSVQLEKITMALRQIDFEVGRDLQVISVSLDPNEQSSRARETRDKYVQLYNRPGSELGWHFLTGENSQIQRLANECGIRYKYIPSQKLFSHPPVFLLISPQGQIVRYIEGFDYISSTVKLALVDAAAGKIGSPLIFLTYVAGCFVYDDTTGQYTLAAMGIMRLAGGLTVLALLVGLVPYWFFRSRKNTAGDPTVDSTGSTTLNAFVPSSPTQASAS